MAKGKDITHIVYNRGSSSQLEISNIGQQFSNTKLPLNFTLG